MNPFQIHFIPVGQSNSLPVANTLSWARTTFDFFALAVNRTTTTGGGGGESNLGENKLSSAMRGSSGLNTGLIA